MSNDREGRARRILQTPTPGHHIPLPRGPFGPKGEAVTWYQETVERALLLANGHPERLRDMARIVADERGDVMVGAFWCGLVVGCIVGAGVMALIWRLA